MRQPNAPRLRNRGNSSLKSRRRSENPMLEYDRLPKELRAWMATAVLPWRPKSVRRAFDAALKRTGNRAEALAELDHLQSRRIATDAPAVWGQKHPLAQNSLPATLRNRPSGISPPLPRPPS